ncbi:uncharacterized protein LOC118270658 [Spodoptera frugiperda]|uniref:Uncharacterized protein LOC118270658 n=1 Tax=Spodoptera frugiperda TaxID=7108 RepID=A0A9R0ELS4_SPOFR|nr:uncharacterized protein LOC118270658 [Spodoptera frugiperda]
MAARVVLITEQQLLIEVLAKYRELPVLWDITHKHYNHRDVRKKAYEYLLEYYNEYDKTATIYTLKKKIENMRSAYKREIKKVEKGVVDGQPYTPSLWYFNHLKFLDQEYTSLDYDSDTNLTYGPVPKKAKTRMHEQNVEDDDALTSSSDGETLDDESAEAFGKTVTCTLKELPKLQRCLAEKLMSEVLFYAKMDQLHLSSMITLNNDGENTE